MLVAALRGKSVPDFDNVEDCLTSIVFEHLRYLPPNIFWPELFRYSLSLQNQSLGTYFRDSSIDLLAYDHLSLDFWPRLEGGNEPDLILRFTGLNTKPLLLVIEVKLWSGKSGVGEDDQLVRYMAAAQHLAHKEGALFAGVIYLSPVNSVEEVGTSWAIAKVRGLDAPLWRLQWQDVLAALRTTRCETQPYKMVIEDVARFLEYCGFEHFSGFRMNIEIPSTIRGHFYQSAELFSRCVIPEIYVRRAAWTEGVLNG